MNIRTGEIETFPSEAALKGRLAELRGQGKQVLVPVKRTPDPECKRCHGRGSRPRGTAARRVFIPCRCVL